jgi:hypothetical protein
LSVFQKASPLCETSSVAVKTTAGAMASASRLLEVADSLQLLKPTRRSRCTQEGRAVACAVAQEGVVALVRVAAHLPAMPQETNLRTYWRRRRRRSARRRRPIGACATYGA